MSYPATKHEVVEMEEWQNTKRFEMKPLLVALLIGLVLLTACPCDFSLEIVSVTSPVSSGSNATLVAQTIPGAECDITVYYKSGASTASGLYPKTADSSGRVS